MVNLGDESGERGFEQQILEAENQIAKAISKLFNLEDILHTACCEIQAQLGFDYVGISLVLLSQNTIEAVHGIGIAENWANRARHYVEDDPDLRDIQADIVKTGRTEIITGWDNRFDRWIFDTFSHEQVNRIFTPILLIRNGSGKVSRDWFEHYDWNHNFTLQEGNTREQHKIIDMKFPPDFASVKVIGTIEAGYQDRKTAISYEKAVELAKIAARQALDIRQTRLRCVLELIAENAKKILQADLITLHFLLDSHQDCYIYQVRSGAIKNLVPEAFPPRLNNQGVGWQAIQERKPKFISSDIGSFNSVAFQEGSRSYAAFPLLFDQNKQKVIHQTTAAPVISGDDLSQAWFESITGVLYVHFQHEHKFTEDEVHRGEFLAERAVDAIWHATTYQQVRDNARQLDGLHSVTQSISQVPENGDILGHIAWNTLNVLAADIITIYAYLQTDKQFVTPPCIAGRLKASGEMGTEIHEGDIPFALIHGGKSIYASNLSEKIDFVNSPFAKRENIKSVAGILLRIDEDIVGIMFINYRRSHIFTKAEKQTIKTLASSAATAIKNQRWLQTLSNIEREIITTLEPHKLLDLIVQRAVQITGADLGAVRCLEPIGQDLIAQAIYPADEPVDQAWSRVKIGEGIAGRVAMHRRPELVEDVRNDQSYLPYFSNALSEICVPLLDQDGEDGIIIGVLNVESRKKVFTQRDLQRLEVLADLAVIAIQNADTKKKLSKMEVMATLGELTSQLLHRMNNDVGASKILLREIKNSLNRADIEVAKGSANRALQLINRISQNLGGLKTWRQEQPQLLSIQQTISKALEQVQVPNGNTLRIDLPPSLPTLFCGQQQLLGVFDNLIQNAIEAMPDGGILSIIGRSIERETSFWIEICVGDTGLGIPKENLEEIFELGFTTKSDQGSMGFGLWWTRSQIESLGGQLSVRSTIGSGSQFTLILPAQY